MMASLEIVCFASETCGVAESRRGSYFTLSLTAILRLNSDL
jgi:hypothetical protein